MDLLNNGKMYGDLKKLSSCLYIDLDSESSDKMLYQCSDTIAKKINDSLEKKEVIEGFSSNCCPDGTTSVNNECVKVCINCKYNDCNHGSENLGNFYNYSTDTKEKKHLNEDELMFNYIVLDVPDN